MPIDDLLEGHSRFKGKFADEVDLYDRLAKQGQKPKALWIGCSDSRAIPEEITDSEAGELFVLRNVANIVPPSGQGENETGAVVEYGVLHLAVPHIVICGHTECGGIKALGEDIDVEKAPHIARWLAWAQPARVEVERKGVIEAERYLETIKANVLLQRDNLRTYACVQEAEGLGSLMIHCWLYDLYTGDLLAYDDEAGEWRKIDQEKEW